MKKYSKNLIFIFLVAVAFLIFTILFGNSEENISLEATGMIVPNALSSVPSQRNGVKELREKIFSSELESATLSAGGSAINLSFPAGATLYEAMSLARDVGSLSFTGKNYPGLGFLVTEIENLHGSGGKYLFYYINGEEASVGVSTQKLKDGDVIEWKLK